MDDYTIKQLLNKASNNDIDSMIELINYYLEDDNFNERIVAYFSSVLFELDKKYAEYLGMCYLCGIYFPKIYTFAKYCYLKSGYSIAELNEYFKLDNFDWKDINEIKPSYPKFKTDIEGFFTSRSSSVALEEAMAYAGVIKKDGINEVNINKSIKYFEEACKYSYPTALYNYAMYFDYDDENATVEYNSPLKEQIISFGYKKVEEIIEMLFTAANLGDLDSIIYIINKIISNYYENNDKYQEAFLDAYTWIAIRLKLYHYILPDEETEYVNEYNKFIIHNQDIEARNKEKYFSDLVKQQTKTNKERNQGNNAYIIKTNNEIVSVHIDFTNYKQMDEIINANRTDIISTQALKEKFKFIDSAIIGYCDRYGFDKKLKRNKIMEQLSGYDEIYGDVVICAYEKDYIGIAQDEMDEVLDIIKNEI